jgi:hypothetical protein
MVIIARRMLTTLAGLTLNWRAADRIPSPWSEHSGSRS